MKGTCVSLLFFLILHFNTNAQLRIGILGGLHQSDVKETNQLPNNSKLQQGYSPRTGVHFGFIADLPFSKNSPLFFQPGVMITSKGRKYADSVVVSNQPLYQVRKHYVNYIDIPLNLVVKFKVGARAKLFFGAGPYASFFYNGKETADSYGSNSFFESTTNEDLPVGEGPGKYEVINYGLNGLAGFEIGRFFFNANYSRGLNDFYQAKDYTGSFKHQVIGGTIGVFLGKPVELEKKVKDKDKDGIPDEKDNCPTEAGPELTMGCPDKDGDGLADKEDNCPDQPGTRANKGCPIVDKDGDGINDDKDKCPDVAGLAKYEGCPPADKDSDGIFDDEDKCPEQAGLPRYNGCPIPDTDGDEINDEEDKCPNVKGTMENNGCPEEVKKEIVEKVNYAAKKIQFKINSAVLLASSYGMLDDVAGILQQNPELVLSIEGHTSADGNYESNKKLSQQRAESVKVYLQSKGISTSRLNAKGFGPDVPLNSGKTAAEKAANRRVELKLSN